MAVFGPSETSIPGMALDIFKEFLETALVYVNSGHGNMAKYIFKKPEFFGYTFPGLTDMECAVTDGGKILTHMKIAYNKARKEMGHKYNISNFTSK